MAPRKGSSLESPVTIRTLIQPRKLAVTNRRMWLMASFYKKRGAILVPSLVSVLTVALIAGCTGANDKKPEGRKMDRKNAVGPRSERASPNRLLCGNDYEAFRPGRLKRAILGDVQWRGNFEMACEHQGKSVSAISYGLLASDCSEGLERDANAEKDVVWAIFVDDKFVKFVEWPPSEMEEYDYEGTKASRPKAIRVGDCRCLIRAAEGKPVNIVELERAIKKETSDSLAYRPRLDCGLAAP